MHHSFLIYLLKDVLMASNFWHTKNFEIYIFKVVMFHWWILLHLKHHQMLPWSEVQMAWSPLLSPPCLASSLPTCSYSSSCFSTCLAVSCITPSCFLCPLSRQLLPQVSLFRSQLKWHLLWEALLCWKKSTLSNNLPSQTPVLIFFSVFFAPWNGIICLFVGFLSPHRAQDTIRFLSGHIDCPRTMPGVQGTKNTCGMNEWLIPWYDFSNAPQIVCLTSTWITFPH